MQHRLPGLFAIAFAACSRSTGPDPAIIRPDDYDAAPPVVDASPESGGSSASGGPAAAESLFVEAQKDIADGKVAVACSKFARSYELDPAVGTLVNLAECEHLLGDEAKACAHWALALKTIRSQPPVNAAREKFVEGRLLAAKCPK